MKVAVVTGAGSGIGKAAAIALLRHGYAVTAMRRVRHASGILQADGEVKIEPRMDVAHVADAILYMAGLPLDANVQFLTVMATKMPFIGRG